MATEGDGTLGENLRKERLRRGHTQQTLGAVLDMGRGTIAAIEMGRIANPGVYTLYPFATALGVPMEDLMGVPRVAHTTKGRSRVRELERIRRANGAGDDGDLPSIADAQAEVERRFDALDATVYGEPLDAEAWAEWTADTDLDMEDTLRAAYEYAAKWVHDDVPAMKLVAGAFVSATVAATLRQKSRR